MHHVYLNNFDEWTKTNQNSFLIVNFLQTEVRKISVLKTKENRHKKS